MKRLLLSMFVLGLFVLQATAQYGGGSGSDFNDILDSQLSANVARRNQDNAFAAGVTNTMEVIKALLAAGFQVKASDGTVTATFGAGASNRVDVTKLVILGTPGIGSRDASRMADLAASTNAIDLLFVLANGNNAAGLLVTNIEQIVMGTTGSVAIVLGADKWISGDGDDEGLSIGSTGIVKISAHLVFNDGAGWIDRTRLLVANAIFNMYNTNSAGDMWFGTEGDMNFGQHQTGAYDADNHYWWVNGTNWMQLSGSGSLNVSNNVVIGGTPASNSPDAARMIDLANSTSALHIILSAEIDADVAVVDASLNLTKSDVNIAEINIAINSFRAEEVLSSGRYNMIDGFTDNFTNQVGVDTGAGSNYYYIAAGEYYTWTNHQNDMSSDIVLQYGMNDNAANNTVIDKSGQGNNGTYFDNGATTNTSGGTGVGVITNSLDFVYVAIEDGWYINCGTNFLTTFRSNFSMTCWVKMTDGVVANQQIFGGMDDASAKNQVGFGTHNGVGGRIGPLDMGYDDGTTGARAISDVDVFSNGVNDWRFIAATWDFYQDKMIKLYVDGELVPNQAGFPGTTTGVDPTLLSRVAGETFWIGGKRRIGKADTFLALSGRLDDYRIVRGVMSAEFIKDLFDAESEEHAITVGGAMELISTNGWYAESEPSSGRSLMVIGGDHQDKVKHWISKDNGTNWVDTSAISYGLFSPSAGVWSGTNAYGGTGTNMLMRATCTNNHTEGFIDRWHNAWKD